VDSVNLKNTKMAYKGKDLESIQRTGVHVEVLQKNYASADLDSARKSCVSVARPSEAESLPILGIVIDTNPTVSFATVTGVVPGGAGDRAGLHIGYLITAVNGVQTHNVLDVSQAIAALPPDVATIKLGYAFPSNLGYMPKEYRFG